MATKKRISLDQALSYITDGATIMIGGFVSVGVPGILVEGIAKKGCKNLTVITNDTGRPNELVGRLIHEGCVKKLIASHIGLNGEAGAQMRAGTLEVELVPQGTLAERIRSGGAGLGGILTPVGLGTEVAAGKPVIQTGGQDYLLETPLRADVALLKASVADESGNLWYRGTTRNFNPVMATAADVVIAACEEIVPVGTFQPENIVTPGMYVDFLVGGEDHVS